MAIAITAVPTAAASAQGETFGIAAFTLSPTHAEQVTGPAEGAGEPITRYVQQPYGFDQAGGHPDALTATITFAGEARGRETVPIRDPRDVVIDLPPGLIASPGSVRPCPRWPALEGQIRCPASSQVGVYTMRLKGDLEWFGPIVEVAPEAGQTAELAYESPLKAGLPLIGRLTRTRQQGYGFALVAPGLSGLQIVRVQTTLWGVPAQEAHDPERGLLCHGEASASTLSCKGGGERAGVETAPFVTMPSDCAAGLLTATAYADSWEEPAQWTQASATLSAPAGCASLAFSPTSETSPDTQLADEPVAMTVKMASSQSEGAEAPATPPLREATVVLPQGLSIDPAVAADVQACPASGPEGIDMSSGVGAAGQTLQPEEVGEGEEAGIEGLKRLAPGHCPAASRIGSVEASTPLLGRALAGSVYLAQPLCGGAGQGACTNADAADGRLLRLYIELAGEGVIVKLAGYVDVDPATGQLTVRIPEAPQLPIEDLTISLNGGPQALLANPPECGIATTTSDLGPWSASGTTPEGVFVVGTPDASPSSSYVVSGCSSGTNLSPGFLAGSSNPLAGASSAFTVSVTRGDREPYLRRLQLRLPPGVSARLADVAQCASSLASIGACPAFSVIGAAVVEAGAGSAPLQLHGSIYLTGPYDGHRACMPGQAGCARFGLAIVVDGQAGPFNLGSILVRARVDINPHTAAITITSDPLPQIVLGVPLRLRRVSLEIDRPGFILNPTGCGAERVSGVVEGVAAGGAAGAGTGASTSGGAGASGGAVAASVSSPFAAAACNRLPFAPKLTASTRAGSSRRDGASLALSITAPGHGQANLRKLRLRLPTQLPPRLAAIQAACTAAQFAADPAGCPRGSDVGIATMRTPLLGAPLVGPVYMVSRGGPRFPELAMVLQGEGVTLEVAAKTRISSAHGTIVTASAVPDVPFTSFTLTLPAGRHTALAAPRGRLCRDKLVMPSTLMGQNGAVRRRQVRVRVTGCAHARRKRRGRVRSG